MADPASVLAPLAVPQNVKADAWDAFQNATDQNDFQKRIGALQIPQEAKATLWDMKYAAAPAGQGADDIDAALQKMMQQQSGGSDEGISLGGIGSAFLSQGADIGSNILGAPAALWNAVRHPIDTLSQMATPPRTQIPESRLPQDAFHRLQRRLGGGPNNLAPVDPNTEFPQMVTATLSAYPFIAAPELVDIGKDVAPAVGKFTKAAVKAGGPDVGVGALKVGSGVVLDQFGAPYHVGTVLGVREGAPQIFRGIGKGFKAGRAALQETPPNPPGEPPPPGVPPGPAGPPPPPPGVDPKAWAQLTPEIQDAIYRGAAARSKAAPAAAGTQTPAYSTTTPENIVPEGEWNMVRKVAETNRGNKDLTIVRSLRDEGITKDMLAKMSDDDLRARVKALGYKPSYGKNYSRTWAAFRRDIDKMMDSPSAPSPINPKPIPPQ